MTPERTDMSQDDVNRIIACGDKRILKEQSLQEIREILGYDPGPDVEAGVDKVNEILEGKS